MEYDKKQLKRLKRLRRRKNIVPAILKMRCSGTGEDKSHRGRVCGLTKVYTEKGTFV